MNELEAMKFLEIYGIHLEEPFRKARVILSLNPTLTTQQEIEHFENVNLFMERLIIAMEIHNDVSRDQRRRINECIGFAEEIERLHKGLPDKNGFIEAKEKREAKKNQLIVVKALTHPSEEELNNYHMANEAFDIVEEAFRQLRAQYEKAGKQSVELYGAPLVKTKEPKTFGYDRQVQTAPDARKRLYGTCVCPKHPDIEFTPKDNSPCLDFACSKCGAQLVLKTEMPGFDRRGVKLRPAPKDI